METDKVKLGTKIYVIFDCDIYQEEVFMIGGPRFAHLGCFESVNKEEYRRPLLFSDYNRKWFTSITEAKKVLIKNFQKKNYTVIKKGDYWTLKEIDKNVKNKIQNKR